MIFELWIKSCILDYSHPNSHGYLSCAPDPSVRDQHNQRIDECGNIHHRTIHTPSILSDTPSIFVKKHDQQHHNHRVQQVKTLVWLGQR